MVATTEAQTVSRQSGGGTGLCGNFNGDDDCRVVSDEIFPGGVIDLMLETSSPGTTTFSLRQLADGQPLVEVARRTSCGRQAISLPVPPDVRPGLYLLEVRNRNFGMSVVVIIIEP